MKAYQHLYLVLAIGFSFATSAQAATILVEWDPNTEEDLAGYRVHYGWTAGEYIQVIEAGIETSCQFEAAPATGGTIHIAVTAYDTSGNESGYSDEASVFVPDNAPPGKVIKVRVSIIQRIVRWIRGIFGMAG